MINCIFEDGGKGSLRHVTIDALVIKDNKILLVKRAPHLTNPDKYALPGGFLGRNETTSEAIKREIMEETGYKVKNINLFRINDNPKRIGEDRQNVDFIFIVEAGDKVAGFDKEVKQLELVDLNNLPSPDEFAFDHFENIKLYLKYEEKPFALPVFNP